MSRRKDKTQSKTIRDIKLRPVDAPWRVTLSTRPIGVAMAWSIINKHGIIHKTGSRLHNLLHCRQRKTEPRP